jgi:hypothetical protein
MAKKLDTFELSISQMRIEIDDIKETQDKHIRIIDKQETHHHNVEGRLRNLFVGSDIIWLGFCTNGI